MCSTEDSERNAIMTSVAYLNPSKIAATTPITEHNTRIKNIVQFYGIDNFLAGLWYYDHFGKNADNIELLPKV